LIPGDGCHLCVIEQYVPVCGDGRLESPEQCDDGNLFSGDGCNAVCVIEKPVVPTCHPEGIRIKTKKV